MECPFVKRGSARGHGEKRFRRFLVFNIRKFLGLIGAPQEARQHPPGPTSMNRFDPRGDHKLERVFPKDGVIDLVNQFRPNDCRGPVAGRASTFITTGTAGD
jgi:hypothetical protein